MKNTTNYSLLLPDETDLYKIEDSNSNMQIIDAQLKNNEDALENITSNYGNHASDKSNPHGVTKAQLGLENVPNVTTNNQTPTYSISSTLLELISGESLSVAFGKLSKAIVELISHIANKKNPHVVTKEQIGLGNVDNTSDLEKPLSVIQAAAIEEIILNNDTSGSLNLHVENKNNPHGVTKAQIGLGNCDNTADKDKAVLSASKLTTARTITLGNHVTGSASFDGSNNIDINVSVKNDSHNHSISSVINLQSALDAKQPNIILTENRAVVTSGAGKPIASAITSTELGYLDGVTSNIQTQLNGLKNTFTSYENKGQLGAPMKITAYHNLNNYVTEGIYVFTEEYSPTNIPAGTNGWLIVIPWSKENNDTCKQIWLRHGTLNENDYCIYTRTRILGVWGSWSEIATVNLVHSFSVPEKTIANGSNLNSFKSIGSYRAVGTDAATTLSNCPTLYNFRLDIEFVSSSNYLMQTIIDRTAAIYRRVCDLSSNTWTEWKTY